MIDLPLFAKLLSAIPQNCTVILLGDQYQLASVEAGAVLGDICAAYVNNSFSQDFVDLHAQFSIENNRVKSSLQCTPVIQLKRSFRFDSKSGVGIISESIRRGSQDVVEDMLSPKSEVHLVESVNTEAKVAMSEELRASKTIDEALDRITKGIILTLRNDGDYGQTTINTTIIDNLAKTKKSNSYIENMPIMITENSYDRMLFNGDIGIIRQKEDDGWIAYFRCEKDDVNKHGYKEVALLLLPSWQPAFAMTIHKSQGSEYNKLMIVLGNKPSKLLTRELLYTAITRVNPLKKTDLAKVVVIEGSEEVVKKGIVQKVERFSGITDGLKFEL